MTAETAAAVLDEELAWMLRPAGGGIYAVSTGRESQQALQRRLYGASTDAEVAERWRESLGSLDRARVVMLGIPSDTGAGLVRGAAFGPQALRAALLDRLPNWPALARAAGIVDAGDVRVVPQLLHDEMLSDAQLAASRAALYPEVEAARAAALPVSPLSIAERALTQIATVNPGAKLFVLGGDHSVAWPAIAALCSVRAREPGRDNFAIVHLDAHTDLMPERLGVRYCFATWAHHANDRIGRGGRLTQLGIRASGRPRQHWESTLGVRQFWAAEIRARPDADVIEEVVAHLAAIGAREVYLSNDIDATDAAEAPATGTPEPSGLSPAFVRALITRLAAELSLIGADLVEVAPPIGAPDAARQTIELGVDYMLDSLAALAGVREFGRRGHHGR